MSAAARLLVVLGAVAVAAACLIVFVVRVGLGLTDRADGAAVLALAAIGVAIWNVLPWKARR